MMVGLLLHSVDEKPRFNMSSYPKNRFGMMLDRLGNDNFETITVSQHISHSAPESTAGGRGQPPIQGHYQTMDGRANSSPRQFHHTTAITFDDGLLSYYNNAYPLLEDRGMKSTVFAVAGLVGKTGGWDIMGKTRHMDAAMLREIASKGHEIGSHSLTHANLVWLGDDELMKELRDSKSILEDITGNPVKSLSFPFGSWNRRVWEAAKSAGYEYAAAYRGHKRGLGLPGIMPVLGVYRFDSADDAVDRVAPGAARSVLSSLLSTRTLALAMSHFSKGTPMCIFRKKYYRRFP